MRDNRRQKLILLCGLLLLAGMTSFFISYFARGEVTEVWQLPPDSGQKSGAEPGQAVSRAKGKGVRSVKVYITGEVQRPGLYDVPEQTRALEAVEMAGGFTANADRERTNLSRILRDGAQLKVPALGKKAVKKDFLVGVDVLKRVRSFRRPERGSGTEDTVEGIIGIERHLPETGVKVSINRAGQKELERLPGMYGELARRIVVYREQKNFQRVEELLQVPGMNGKIWEGLRSFVTL